MGRSSNEGEWAFCDNEDEIARLAQQMYDEEMREVGHAVLGDTLTD